MIHQTPLIKIAEATRMGARATSSSKGDKMSKKTGRYGGKKKTHCIVMKDTVFIVQQKINVAREINMTQF